MFEQLGTGSSVRRLAAFYAKQGLVKNGQHIIDRNCVVPPKFLLRYQGLAYDKQVRPWFLFGSIFQVSQIVKYFGKGGLHRVLRALPVSRMLRVIKPKQARWMPA